MKKTFFLLSLLLCLAITAGAQSSKPKIDPSGKWRFDAPYAPEGYNTGIMEFILSEGRYSAFISFPISDYRIPLEGMVVSGDSIMVSLYVEDADIVIRLKMESDTRITGAALSPQGDIPLTAVREKQ